MSRSRRVSIGSVSHEISSCEVDDLPAELLFYAHSGQDTYQDISKIKCLTIHEVNPWVLCGNIDGGITIWDYQKRCKLYQLETWPKSLELLRRQERLRQTQPSSHTLQDTIVLLLFWKYIPDIVAVFYDDRIDIFNLFSKELISQTIIPKFFPTAAIVLKHRYNLLCISCMDGTIRIFDRLQNKIVQVIESPGKSITHFIEIDGIDHLYLSIDKNGPVHLWNLNYQPTNDGNTTNNTNENKLNKSDSNKMQTNVNKLSSINNSNNSNNNNNNMNIFNKNQQPVCELVDVQGKHLHQNINWASFTPFTGELILSHKKNKNHFSFDFSTFMKQNSLEAFNGVFKCQKIYHVTLRFLYAQHLNHPGFPDTAIIGFRNKQATVEIVDPVADHAIEIFDLRKLRKHLPSKLKIYTMKVQTNFIVCGTNVGLFVVNLWANYYIPKLPLAMKASNVQQLFLQASSVGGGINNGDDIMFDNEGVQSPLLRNAVVVNMLPSIKNNLLILYWPLLRDYTLCAKVLKDTNAQQTIPSKGRLEWASILSGHSKSIILCTIDGEIPVVLSLTTERIISIQVLKKNEANSSEDKKSYVTNGPQGIFIIPENMDEGIKLYGGGPVAVLTFKNNTSTFLDIVEEKIIDSSKSQKKNTTPGDDEAKNDKTNEIKTIKKYTLQPVGPKLPLIHLVEWSDTYEYCAVASGDHVHVFRNLPKFRHCTTIPLAMGGPGTSIHLSSAIEGYQCRSMLWYNQALFLLTNNNIYLTFPFNKMNGGNISLIVLAAREVANVLEEKKGSSDNYIDTLNPKPTSMPKNIGNILDNVALVCMDMDNLKKTTNIAALNVRVSRTKNIHSNIFEKDIFNNSEDHKIKGKSNSLGTANLGIPETTPCMFYPIPLLHPTVKFKLLIASGKINEALKHVDKIHPSLHDHLSIFLCGHGYYKEAINKIPGLTKAGMLECILNNKTELKTELPRLIGYSVFHENWMIQHIAIGLAEEKNVESLEKFLELCMKNKLWDQATFISSFLPLHLQMKTAGIIARQERKRIKDLKGNMDGIEAMAKVTTIAKYRPKFSSSSNKNANSKYKKIWSKMPSTESLRRAWNEELDKNFYMKDNIKISRTLSVKKD